MPGSEISPEELEFLIMTLPWDKVVNGCEQYPVARDVGLLAQMTPFALRDQVIALLPKLFACTNEDVVVCDARLWMFVKEGIDLAVDAFHREGDKDAALNLWERKIMSLDQLSHKFKPIPSRGRRLDCIVADVVEQVIDAAKGIYTFTARVGCTPFGGLGARPYTPSGYINIFAGLEFLGQLAAGTYDDPGSHSEVLLTLLKRILNEP